MSHMCHERHRRSRLAVDPLKGAVEMRMARGSHRFFQVPVLIGLAGDMGRHGDVSGCRHDHQAVVEGSFETDKNPSRLGVASRPDGTDPFPVGKRVWHGSSYVVCRDWATESSNMSNEFRSRLVLLMSVLILVSASSFAIVEGGVSESGRLSGCLDGSNFERRVHHQHDRELDDRRVHDRGNRAQ